MQSSYRRKWKRNLSSRDSIMIDIRNAAYHKLNMYELLNAIESVFGLYYWNERK